LGSRNDRIFHERFNPAIVNDSVLYHSTPGMAS
jgi:hypothetical protein